jgi:hypothetical protein
MTSDSAESWRPKPHFSDINPLPPHQLYTQNRFLTITGAFVAAVAVCCLPQCAFVGELPTHTIPVTCQFLALHSPHQQNRHPFQWACCHQPRDLVWHTGTAHMQLSGTTQARHHVQRVWGCYCYWQGSLCVGVEVLKTFIQQVVVPQPTCSAWWCNASADKDAPHPALARTWDTCTTAAQCG